MIAECILCLALNVYFEARAEDTASQLAVAQVTMNRVKDPRYPNKVCKVVKQKNQFSWFWDGKSDKPYERKAWDQALDLAERIIKEPDQYRVSCVSNSTHYHAVYVSPSWAKSFKKYCRVGSHIFYRDPLKGET